MGLASSLPVDFNEFAYLEKERKRNWKQILCYAQNYVYVLTTGSAKDLLTLSSSQRKHAMEALAALSKFTGRYQVWRQIRESHQLNWSDSEEDNLRFFERFTSGEEDYSAMVAWLKEAIAKLPSPVGNVLVFNTMTGLRPTEACQSISIIKQGGQGYVNHEKQVIEHFRRRHEHCDYFNSCQQVRPLQSLLMSEPASALSHPAQLPLSMFLLLPSSESSESSFPILLSVPHRLWV
jgi:hypothetical protein